MSARTLYFTAPQTVAVRRHTLPEPSPDEVRVQTLVSAISAGTEGLLYRGDAPSNLPADSELETIDGDFSFPLSYGYATVGEVTAVGENVAESWLERRVFAYVPHQSHFCVAPDELLVVPDNISTREAALVANLETAVTFLLDGAPLLGERVTVLGQGVVGLLTTALLAEMPLETLVTFDAHERRRQRSESLGADESLDPTVTGIRDGVEAVAGKRADLTYELSGNPDALDGAIAATGFDGRVIVGSWYGTKPTTLDLGGHFHRDRLEISSSQVSTIDPSLRGRWSRERRHEVVWDWLRQLEIDPLLTHEFSLEEADQAYELLEERPDEAIQVLLTYGTD
ncbi:zinc-binding alcohol dehydrogenase [Natronolimnobius sp. AArcel1]|uniref:zinc-dependent alcohol dehydrogenase n=1 Tax=Natronolimnobius sp. AArcel1 TaxID=1679093 RepID=UPI0031B695FE